MTRHSLRDDATTDYRTTHASAYRRGVECAAICEGDTERQRNPYPSGSEDALAFAAGWKAWVLSVLRQREEADPFAVALDRLTRIMALLDEVPEGLGGYIDDTITNGYNELDSALGHVRSVCEWHEEMREEAP